MFVKLYVIAFLVFLIVDAVWLGLVAPNFYKKHIGHLMAESPNFIAALVFYLLFIIGLVFFVIYPAVDRGELSYAIYAGLLFGFMTYATYDLTNLATLKDWPIIVTVVDLAWGSFLSAVISTVTYWIYFAIWS